ncbi:MAG: DNA polymerase III subunit beta [Clostridia bacterium]
MRIICDGLTLADAVLKVSKALPQKTSNPVLDGLKLVAKDETLTLFATDLNFSIEKTIPATVITPGELIIPGRLFTEFTRKLASEQQIEILVNEEKQIILKYTDSQSVFQCLDNAEYPNFNKPNKEKGFLVGEEELKDIINKVIFSAATEDSRPILKGVLFEVDDYTLTAVCLDGYRLAQCKKPLIKQSEKMSAVVPARILAEIAKLLEDGDNIATIYLDKNMMYVDLSHTKISTSLLSGEYINYKQILPQQFVTSITANREQFINALDRASIISRNEKRNFVTLEIKENLLVLTANSEVGNIKESITISLWGKDIIISLTTHYLSDCLKVIPNEFIKIQFNTSVTPCIVTPCETDEYLYLILPIRMN